MNKIKNSGQGFTLLELLVVVLIIGILAAIAVPQYRRVVMRANLYKGISLVSSLIEAEQTYYLQHGEHPQNLDDLDLLIPYDESCTKWDESTASGWDCPWGGIETDAANGAHVDFIYPVHTPPTSVALLIYLHFLQDSPNAYIPKKKFEAGKRYCFAKPSSTIAQTVCQDVGGVYLGETSVWKYYEIN